MATSIPRPTEAVGSDQNTFSSINHQPSWETTRLWSIWHWTIIQSTASSLHSSLLNIKLICGVKKVTKTIFIHHILSLLLLRSLPFYECFSLIYLVCALMRAGPPSSGHLVVFLQFSNSTGISIWDALRYKSPDMFIFQAFHRGTAPVREAI